MYFVLEYIRDRAVSLPIASCVEVIQYFQVLRIVVTVPSGPSLCAQVEKCTHVPSLHLKKSPSLFVSFDLQPLYRIHFAAGNWHASYHGLVVLRCVFAWY